ncbi:MAG: hypothetical protein OHK0038_07890 [Flammeovirgaceae bacterium]
MPKFKVLVFSMLITAMSSVAWSQDITDENVEKKPTDYESQRSKLLENGNGPQKPKLTVYATGETRTYKKAKHNGNSTQLTMVRLSNVNLANAQPDPVLMSRKQKTTVQKRTHTPRKKGK